MRVRTPANRCVRFTARLRANEDYECAGHRPGLAIQGSGKAGMKEAYRFTVSPSGDVHFEPKVIKRSAPPKA
jgi:hypothetical protein